MDPAESCRVASIPAVLGQPPESLRRGRIMLAASRRLNLRTAPLHNRSFACACSGWLPSRRHPRSMGVVWWLGPRSRRRRGGGDDARGARLPGRGRGPDGGGALDRLPSSPRPGGLGGRGGEPPAVIAGGRPYAVARHALPAVAREGERLVASGRFDAVHAERLLAFGQAEPAPSRSAGSRWKQ